MADKLEMTGDNNLSRKRILRKKRKIIYEDSTTDDEQLSVDADIKSRKRRQTSSQQNAANCTTEILEIISLSSSSDVVERK